jgi:hypothetical protein
MPDRPDKGLLEAAATHDGSVCSVDGATAVEVARCRTLRGGPGGRAVSPHGKGPTALPASPARQVSRHNRPSRRVPCVAAGVTFGRLSTVPLTADPATGVVLACRTLIGRVRKVGPRTSILGILAEARRNAGATAIVCTYAAMHAGGSRCLLLVPAARAPRNQPSVATSDRLPHRPGVSVSHRR